MIKKFQSFFKNIFSKIFRKKKHIKLGLYGPPNAGKTTLANKISQDWLGENVGTVSKIPHETREIQVKEKIEIKGKGGKAITFNLVDTPGIATRIDYEDFLKFKLTKAEAKKRAKEATKGVIEAIKWLDSMDCVVVVLDSTLNPYSQVNLTIIGNLAAREIPVIVIGNKIDLKKAKIKSIENAFPQYKVLGVSAEKGINIEEFYESLFEVIR
ncbi:MAG: 50S ribosome-binding GTPase [Candidatus Nanoarchaeia archaeon]|nr:50S ribosome-binding GTPase [Candidatus Nanoarchaeia archaeon]